MIFDTKDINMKAKIKLFARHGLINKVAKFSTGRDGPYHLMGNVLNDVA